MTTTRSFASSTLLGALLLGIGCGAPVRDRASATARAPARDDFSYASLVAPDGHLLDEVRQVSAGASYTCALRADATVWCWGDNSVGQLGDGTRTSTNSPVRVRSLPPARWIAAGESTSCAAALDGRLHCWGGNAFGQIGNGERANGYALPVRVSNIDDAALAAGTPLAERHCAIRESGALECWGALNLRDTNGRQILASEVPERCEGFDRVASVAIGATEECALTEEGAVFCRREARRFSRVSDLDRVVSIAIGARHACAARADGAVYCWGENDRGQLGTSRAERSADPLRVDLADAVRAVVAGAEHTCALGELGSVYCWGGNAHRQVGDAPERVPAPRRIALQGRAIDLDAGARHTCVVLSDGQLRCWGDNLGGQLGDGTNGERTWPVAVLDGPELGEDLEEDSIVAALVMR
jgi:alpha-tubulin suppressor-like RCC1 family protein